MAHLPHNFIAIIEISEYIERELVYALKCLTLLDLHWVIDINVCPIDQL